MNLRRFLQEQFFAGPSFQVPVGYHFVRREPKTWTSEYWLWPFHWVARAWYWSMDKLVKIRDGFLTY